MKKHRTCRLTTVFFLLVSKVIIHYSHGQQQEAVVNVEGDVDFEDISDLDAVDLDANVNVENDPPSDGLISGTDDVNSAPSEPAVVTEDESTLERHDASQQSQDVMPSSNRTREDTQAPPQPPAQSGPYVDMLGDVLISLEMVDETHAQVHQHLTNEALAGKKVVGLYFSADWCGPCRQFTPDLVTFYDKMNSRRGKKDEFEIVWISRCRSVDDFGQYFTQMKWLALPPQEAMGERGQYLGEKFKVKSIPTLVLLDEIGNVITTDGRNKIPMDKAGIGFPWRSPISILISTVVPRSFRLLIKSQVGGVLDVVKRVFLNGEMRGLGGVVGKIKEAVAERAGGQRR